MTRTVTNIATKRAAAWLACLFVCLFAKPGFAEVRVICHPDVKAEEVSAEDVKSVFLGMKTSFKGGIRLKPVLEKSGPGHEEFLREFLGKTDGGLQTYYRSLVFTGKASMPTMLSTDAEIVLYVARTPGAIGYINADTPASGVRTLRIR